MQIHSQTGAYRVEFISLEHIETCLPRDARFITDHTVQALYPQSFNSKDTFAFAGGESAKNLQNSEKALRWLAQSGASRNTSLVAVGGGVVGDLAGFVAASYMRGIPFIQIPTTLLAMVDSSVGGKVGIDLPEGKNLVGAFKSPENVFVNLSFLQTLPIRQFRNGMAEVLKCGFILDQDLWLKLDRFILSQSSSELESVVQRCIEHKANVVEADEFETKGIRAKLNFGHTIGHAIEQVLNYESLLHGEAISIGMVLEARLGEDLGVTPSGVSLQVARTLTNYELPCELPPEIDSELLLKAMYRDKKAIEGRLAFSLLTEIGGCTLVKDVDPERVLKVLRDQ